MNHFVKLLALVALLLPLRAWGEESAWTRFAATGKLEPGRAPALWDLLSADPELYPGIFRHATTPRLEDFRGQRFNGVILLVQKWELGKILFTQYTGRNADLVTGKLYARPLTFRKRFHGADSSQGESGINFWPVRGTETMPMKISLAQGILDDGRESLLIDYDVPSNRRVTERPLLDEVRRIPGTQLYLGRMYYRVHGLSVPFLWFALERVAGSASR